MVVSSELLLPRSEFTAVLHLSPCPKFTSQLYLLLVTGATKIVAQALMRNGYGNGVRSLFGAGMNLGQSYISQVIVNP